MSSNNRNPRQSSSSQTASRIPPVILLPNGYPRLGKNTAPNGNTAPMGNTTLNRYAAPNGTPQVNGILHPNGTNHNGGSSSSATPPGRMTNGRTRGGGRRVAHLEYEGTHNGTTPDRTGHNGHLSNGNVPHGKLTNGNMITGHAPNRHRPNGHRPSGPTSNRRAPQRPEGGDSGSGTSISEDSGTETSETKTSTTETSKNEGFEQGTSGNGGTERRTSENNGTFPGSGAGNRQMPTPRTHREPNDPELPSFINSNGSYHSVTGPCPYLHGCDEGNPPQCCCNCEGCPRTNNPSMSIQFKRGWLDGPGRKHFPPPAHIDVGTPLPDQSNRCTEWIPWNVRKTQRTRRCPHDRRSPTNPYANDIWECRAEDCHGPFDPSAGENRVRGITRVCQDHINDSRNFWEIDNLYQAHLVPTCTSHRAQFSCLYPDGRNTCTCANLIDRWQCRSCLERSIHTLQNHFRVRVEPRYMGRADRHVVRRKGYHRDWQGVRQMLIERHRCSYRCGNQRDAENTQVLDCRACGGVIIKPTRQFASAARTRTRATRGNAQGAQLWQLDDRGNPVVARDAGRAVVEEGEESWPPMGTGYQSPEGSERQGSVEARGENESEFKGSVSPPPDGVGLPTPPLTPARRGGGERRRGKGRGARGRSARRTARGAARGAVRGLASGRGGRTARRARRRG